VLRQLELPDNPDLLVGAGTGDDAAVYRLSDDTALIQTVDFFPPIVDDPFSYGEIAVANALSDVYAMGGRPLLGLNIVGFPVDLPNEVLVNVLKGGLSKAAEAGLLIVGGHTVDDEEPKYGLSVTGVIRPGLQVTNAGARPGDALVLTKPIGTGIITTAGKQQKVDPGVLDRAVQTMSALNKTASEAMMEVGVNACVDVTGFGLIGHLLNMVRASDVSAEVSIERTPYLDGVWELVRAGITPGGTHRNLKSSDGLVVWGEADPETKLVLCDAQTSGGLLIAVPAERRDLLVAELEKRGVATTAVIGRVMARRTLGDRRIRVIP